jgi:carboxyl-terminal processing protease
LNSKSKYAILLVSSVLVVYAIIGGMMGRVSAQNGSYQQLSIFTEVLRYIQNDYVDDPSMKDALTGAVRGLIESVDQNGGYLTPKELAFYKDFNPQKSQGIGAVLARRYGYPVIVSALANGPAAKAGLGTGDIIESIEGVTTREMNIVQVESLLAAPAGKPVKLSVIRRRKADPEPLTLTREPMQVPAVETKIVDNVAYVRVPYLGTGKAQEVKKQLDGLLKKNVAGVVLDLRATAGGEDKEGAQLANLFMDSGTIATLQGQKFEKETFSANPKEAITKVPVVAIVNQGTAGAAEITAGALADSKRGAVIGTKTFGSGSFQKILPMDDGAGLLISVAKYYTPAGTEIETNGIKPTVEVLQPSEDLFNPDDEGEVVQPAKTPGSEDDRQLKRAIEIVKDPSKATKKAA